MFVVGLTGGIGSGKSAVAERFAALGVPVIDTDEIARELTARDGPALPEIRARWGDAVFAESGQLDRAALRRRVFGDAAERAALEAILHPLIRQEVERRIALLDGKPGYALLVVPLLIETAAYRTVVQRVLAVDCPESIRIRRVQARSGLAREEVEAIVAAQASDATRRAAADDIVDNGGSPEALEVAVAKLHVHYLDLARTAPAL